MDFHRKAAWMHDEVYARWNVQKHRHLCDTLGSILALGVEVMEGQPIRRKKDKRNG